MYDTAVIDFGISHQTAPLRKLYSMTLTYFPRSNSSNANISETVRASLKMLVTALNDINKNNNNNINNNNNNNNNKNNNNNNNNNKISKTRRHAHIRPNCHRNCTWDKQATELIEEIGRRCTLETEDPKETIYLYQRIAIAIQRGNTLSFTYTFDIDADMLSRSTNTVIAIFPVFHNFLACRLCAGMR